MFPKHCSVVSVKEVSFPLTEKDIRDNLLGKSIYKKTGFLILKNENDWAIVAIGKAPPQDLFSTIEDVEILSLPENTKYVEDPAINVLSPTMMAEKAQELGCEILIVKGKFEHISFIHREELQPLAVFEVVPPEPPKLVELVREVMHSEFLPKPVKILPHILDLREVEKQGNQNNVMFPCHASGLTSEKNTYFLDQGLELPKDDIDNILLIGCDLSLRIFKSLYAHEPEFFNFCPKKRAMEADEGVMAIARCCTVKEGYERIDNIALVPWGATQREVEDALNDLLKNS